MTQREQLIDESQIVEHLQGGWVHRVAAEVTQEIFVFLEDQRVDAGARQQEPEHHAGGAASSDAACHPLRGAHIGWLHGRARFHQYVLFGMASAQAEAASASAAASNIAARKPVTYDAAIAAWSSSCMLGGFVWGACAAASLGRCALTCATTCGGGAIRARAPSNARLNAPASTRLSVATASSPAVLATALLMPDAMPKWSLPTESMTVVVSGATTSDMTKTKITAGQKNVSQ